MGLASPPRAQIFRKLRSITYDKYLGSGYLTVTLGKSEIAILAININEMGYARGNRHYKWVMTRHESDLSVDSSHHNGGDISFIELPVGSDYDQSYRIFPDFGRIHGSVTVILIRFEHVIEIALHKEILLRDMIERTGNELAECLDGLINGNISRLIPGRIRGYEERL